MTALLALWAGLGIRNKIVVPIAAIALLMALTVTPITAAVFTARTNERAVEQIAGVANLFKVIVSQKESDLLAWARTLPKSAEFEEAWSSGDPRALAALLSGYRVHLSIDLLLIVDESGRPIAGSGGLMPPVADVPGLPVIKRALGKNESVEVMNSGTGLCLCVAAPVTDDAGDVVAAILLGNMLDDAYVGKVKQSSGVDVLLRRDGRVRASSLPSELTRLVSGTDSFQQVARWSSVSMESAQDSIAVLGLPYRVTHSALETPQGNVIKYSMLLPMNESERATREAIMLLLMVGGFGTLVLMVVGLWIARYVARRLGELVDASRRLAGGDWSQRIVVGAVDEVGELSRAFNQMATSLEARDQLVRQHQRELETRNEELMRLNRLSQSINASLELHDALNAVCEATTELIRVPLSAIALIEPGSRELRIAQQYSRGEASRNGSGDPRANLCEDLVSQVFQDAAAHLSCNGGSFLGAHVEHQPGETRAVLCAPLQLQDRSLGVIYACDLVERGFTEHEINLMGALANEATVAITNATLYEEARNKATALSAMVQEMHHRIKNNLQTVADLLSLEMIQAGDSVRDELGSSIARVKSIATVHELLSADDTACTDVRKLSERLLTMAIQTVVVPGKQIVGSVSGPSLRLPSKQATSLALVLNELISNALEHGFVDRQRGSISITLEEGSSQSVITVRDDGVGLPPGFMLDGGQGLGLEIVKTLVTKELRGELVLAADAGTAAIIRFCAWR
ncbi:MAG: HAMP domain-containing protein [Chloroflexota bacterium]|nr:MAG: HAMP domain-containing protein [Chloroflexota bacterium]